MRENEWHYLGLCSHKHHVFQPYLAADFMETQYHIINKQRNIIKREENNSNSKPAAI
jgi:hypothetical protein